MPLKRGWRTNLSAEWTPLTSDADPDKGTDPGMFVSDEDYYIILIKRIRCIEVAGIYERVHSGLLDLCGGMHSLSAINVNCNPSDSCWHISVWTTVTSVRRWPHYECRICRWGTKTLVFKAIWFPFVVWVLLSGHVWSGFGGMHVESPCGEQERRNASITISRENMCMCIFTYIENDLTTIDKLELEMNFAWISALCIFAGLTGILKTLAAAVKGFDHRPMIANVFWGWDWSVDWPTSPSPQPCCSDLGCWCHLLIVGI